MGFRLTDQEAWLFVAQAQTSILTTLRRDGTPVTLPVWHVVHDRVAYVRTPAGTAKIARVRNDPRVAFLVEPGERWIDLKAVSMHARASVEEDPEVIARVRQMFAEKYAGSAPPLDRLPPRVAELYSADHVVLALRPEGPLSSWNNSALLID